MKTQKDLYSNLQVRKVDPVPASTVKALDGTRKSLKSKSLAGWDGGLDSNTLHFKIEFTNHILCTRSNFQGNYFRKLV